jgi:DNA polymerase elongation subunit (family B)
MKITKEDKEKMKYCLLEADVAYGEADIKAEMARLERMKTLEKNKDVSFKRILNSIYGVLGFLSFICYNRDVAQTVTKQSEHLAKFTIRMFNEFFKNFHRMKKIHDAMGITKVEPIDWDVVNYAATDSQFIVLERVIKHTDYKGDAIEFSLELYEKGLKQYIEKQLDNYVEHFHGFKKKGDGEPALKLTIEEVDYNILWEAKNRYVKNPAWIKGRRYKYLENLTAKGGNLNTASMPEFVRKKLLKVVEFLFQSIHDVGSVDTNKLLSMLISIKDEFKNMDIEAITGNSRVNDYEKYVLCDTTKLELESGCPEHIKAAAYHNYMLYNSQYKARYNFIKSGDKVYFYCISEGLVGVFGFASTLFPVEFAPPVNLDLQFEKVFLNPLNTVLEAAGIPRLNPDLLWFPSLW